MPCFLAVTLFTDLITDDTTYDGTTNRSDAATTCEDSAANSAYTGTGCGTLVPMRHPGTAHPGEQHCRQQCVYCKSIHRFHDYCLSVAP